MKGFFIALSMAFSMFSAIPCPCPRWEESLRSRMLFCLPLVGIFIGLLWAGCAWLLDIFLLPPLLTAVILAICPWIFTGFLHLDGYMDCSDAILSRRDLPTRQKILKDPHVGSFAVIALVILCALSIALLNGAALSDRLPTLLLIPAISRCASVASILSLSPMEGSSYQAIDRDRGGSIAMLLLALACSALAVLLCGLPGLGGIAALLTALLAIRYGVKQLGGMSGDISGFGITIGELCGVAVMTLL